MNFSSSNKQRCKPNRLKMINMYAYIHMYLQSMRCVGAIAHMYAIPLYSKQSLNSKTHSYLQCSLSFHGSPTGLAPTNNLIADLQDLWQQRTFRSTLIVYQHNFSNNYEEPLPEHHIVTLNVMQNKQIEVVKVEKLLFFKTLKVKDQ